MTKYEIQSIIDDLRQGKSYVDSSLPPERYMDQIFELMAPLEGLALPDFEKGKMVRKEAIVHFLRWQCLRLDGTIDEEELSSCVELLKSNRVIMI